MSYEPSGGGDETSVFFKGGYGDAPAETSDAYDEPVESDWYDASADGGDETSVDWRPYAQAAPTEEEIEDGELDGVFDALEEEDAQPETFDPSQVNWADPSIDWHDPQMQELVG